MLRAPEGVLEIGLRVGAAEEVRTRAHFADGIERLAVLGEIDALGEALEHGELIGVDDEFLIAGRQGRLPASPPHAGRN